MRNINIGPLLKNRKGSGNHFKFQHAFIFSTFLLQAHEKYFFHKRISKLAELD